MSTLDFLSVGAATGGALAKSSMEQRQREAGARFEERDGWLVPVAILGEEAYRDTVGVADLSHLTKFEIRPDAAVDAGSAAVHYRISPRRGLVLCEPSEAAGARSQLAGRVLDVTGALGILVLRGPLARTLLARLTHLHDLPQGGEVAHVTAHVLAPGPDAYWIVFPQEYGHYLWEVAVDRAEPLGGGPVGVDAL